MKASNLIPNNTESLPENIASGQFSSINGDLCTVSRTTTCQRFFVEKIYEINLSGEGEE